MALLFVIVGGLLVSNAHPDLEGWRCVLGAMGLWLILVSTK